MSRMRNLTLASAKHLLNMGHITPAHHAKIIAQAAPKMPTMPKMPTGAFGSLAQKPKKKAPAALPMAPQQAQMPIPGVGNGPPVIPPGMMAGNPED